MSKELCPVHRVRLNKSMGWMPPEGLDPKMVRYACPFEFDDYWYKVPKYTFMRKKDVQAEFGIEVF